MTQGNVGRLFVVTHIYLNELNGSVSEDLFGQSNKHEQLRRNVSEGLFGLSNKHSSVETQDGKTRKR